MIVYQAALLADSMDSFKAVCLIFSKNTHSTMSTRRIQLTFLPTCQICPDHWWIEALKHLLIEFTSELALFPRPTPGPIHFENLNWSKVSGAMISQDLVGGSNRPRVELERDGDDNNDEFPKRSRNQTRRLLLPSVSMRTSTPMIKDCCLISLSFILIEG